MSSLLIIQGPQIGARFLLGDITVIGRDEACEGHLADSNASRRHAEIVRDRLTYTIRDLGSANGVWVNGIQREERLLRRNDLIAIGSTRLLFDAEPDLENALYGGAPVAMGASHEETLRAHQSPSDAVDDQETGRIGVELIGEIGDLVAAKAQTLPDLLRRVTSRLAEMFGAERSVVFLWDSIGERLSPAVTACDSESMDVDQTLLMRVFTEKRPILAADLTPDLSALRREGGDERPIGQLALEQVEFGAQCVFLQLVEPGGSALGAW